MKENAITVEYLLDNPQLINYAYQPIFRLKDNSIYGYEALMRPEPYTPIEFIKAVSKMDKLYLIEEITNYYATKKFMELDLEGRLFLNSFPSVCMRIEQTKKVAALGGDRMKDRLVYEILEYTKFERYAWEMKKVAFSMEGAHPMLALDDYGTGSNIDRECLDFYKPDMVKIDRKFVNNVDEEPEKQIIVKDIISKLRERDIIILAEGIETKEEYEFFKEMQIDLVQGFYLGRPMYA
ncbi:MAG: EAL domain-containing protein, partial [Butyrivibrio sp.]|nr:EAL domain-containing protein [Butyrivibrio sp.]